MTATASASRSLNTYQREAILSASPARLLVMLYDRLLVDLFRAEAAQGDEEWDTARTNLLHAQDILAELAGSLDIQAWDGAQSMLAIYNYASTALTNANIHRNIDLTRECIALLEPLRQSWHEAATQPTSPAAGPAGGIG